ncbi:site-specific DNA-methyltransferase [Pontibacter sp. BT213]|uniref:site-specific DNA-methyltransferase (cytosine-N(4)-specific) n=1 Tax=Pontibacter fetidus TaxID=2700082 RepID=A0A6B2H6F3_9BACT|nr:site-specific DNA-methyltransferase [Pontibacter fetidus]
MQGYEALRNINWNFQDSISDTIHSIHPYPAKFISDIPRAVLRALPIPKDTIVLDPFCGSGVTLVEAQRAGIESVGVDLNPIACLLSRVKVNILDRGFLKSAESVISNCLAYEGAIEIPLIPNLDHWFRGDVQEAITLIIREINSIENHNIQDALRFCLSSIIVKVSNQESDTRYAAIEKNYRKADVFDLFSKAAKKLAKVKNESRSIVASSILNKSSLTLNANDFNKKIGLVITSPPYPNAYEYWLYHKYRMWWLGYDPIDVKEQEIGARAHYFKKNHQTEHDFIRQMNELFSSLQENMIDGGYAVFVIGRSKIHGRIIENHKIVKEAGENNGFEEVLTTTRVIKASRKSFNLSHARIKEEYIVVLKKRGTNGK